MLKIYVLFSLSLLLIFTGDTRAFPEGPPTSVCSNGLVPTGHTGTSQANDSPGSFYIFSELLDEENDGEYMADTMYDGELKCNVFIIIIVALVIMIKIWLIARPINFLQLPLPAWEESSWASLCRPGNGIPLPS